LAKLCLASEPLFFLDHLALAAQGNLFILLLHRTLVLLVTIGGLYCDWVTDPTVCLFFSIISSEAATNAGYNIGVEFLINSYSLSGLKVDVLKLFNESYKPYKGVRTMTKAGRYQVRAWKKSIGINTWFFLQHPFFKGKKNILWDSMGLLVSISWPHWSSEVITCSMRCVKSRSI
jgi:hypothetical protein